MTDQKTVGEVLVDLLESNGVEFVFGIPGVHTVELYRGLANSKIRHVTARHEGSAGFMADGYARASGKPGVCFLITGPGLTNAITAMAQARADSVPMLVISGVNSQETLGHEEGYLHELPDQMDVIKSVALFTHRLHRGADLVRVLDRAITVMTFARPGPVHIEIPIDVMSEVIPIPTVRSVIRTSRYPSPDVIHRAAALCADAKRPLLMLGGGARRADPEATALAEALNAPAVMTVNARGMLASHPLAVPASPSLTDVRQLVHDSDLTIAVGTEMGSTDYDMDLDGNFPQPNRLIRIDIDPVQATRNFLADVVIAADAAPALSALCDAVLPVSGRWDGAMRARQAREAVLAGLGDKMRRGVDLVHTISAALPGCLLVGDSTELIYAGNLYCEIDRVGGWFNSATGYGTLGYGPSAAIGAALAVRDTPVVCIVGDGGIQFSIADLGTAMDEDASVIFLVWNNHGYKEIENFMTAKDITPVGVHPTPPDFMQIAKAYGLEADLITDPSDLAQALEGSSRGERPTLIEVRLS